MRVRSRSTFCFIVAIAALSLSPVARAQETETKAKAKANEKEGRQQEATEKKPHDLPKIVVIGRQREEGVPEVPLGSVGSRNVFGPERVKETGARDLNDLIQNLPGVSTRPYNGGEAAAPSFSMRGLPDDGLTEYVHVLIDGIPASSLPYGWTAFSFMPITTERVYAVDYIRGGHAIRYSPNTVGGVSNFISQPIPREPFFESRSTFGNFDYTSQLVSIGGTHEDVGALLTYVDRRGDGYRDDGGFDQQDVNAKFRIDFGQDHWIAASASYMRDEHQAPGGLTAAQFQADRFANARPEGRFEGHKAVVDVVYHSALGEDGFFEPFVYMAEGRRNLFARRPRFGAPTTQLEWEDVAYYVAAGFRVEQSFALLGTEHTAYGGFRYHRDWIPSWTMHSMPFGGGTANRTQDSEFALNSYSAHLDDTFSPIKDVTVTLGARVEWVPDARGDDDVTGLRYKDRFARVLPGAGLAWTFHEDWALFGNYMEGFRPPQVWGFAFAPPGADLEFELGRHAEVGIRFRDVHGFSGEVTGWRLDFDEFTTFVGGFYDNLGRIVSVGTDAVLEWNVGDVIAPLEGLVLSGTVTWQDSEMKKGVNDGNDVPYAWDTKAAWRVRYERKNWVVSVGGVTVGHSFSDAANTRAPSADGQVGRNDGWTLWDARVAHTLALGENSRLEVAAGATNLFDRDWEIHSRGGFFGGGLVAGSPRRSYASIQLGVNF